MLWRHHPHPLRSDEDFSDVNHPSYLTDQPEVGGAGSVHQVAPVQRQQTRLGPNANVVDTAGGRGLSLPQSGDDRSALLVWGEVVLHTLG